MILLLGSAGKLRCICRLNTHIVCLGTITLFLRIIVGNYNGSCRPLRPLVLCSWGGHDNEVPGTNFFSLFSLWYLGHKAKIRDIFQNLLKFLSRCFVLNPYNSSRHDQATQLTRKINRITGVDKAATIENVPKQKYRKIASITCAQLRLPGLSRSLHPPKQISDARCALIYMIAFIVLRFTSTGKFAASIAVEAIVKMNR